MFDKTLLTSKEKSVYLDTSFILHATSESIDHNKKTVSNAMEMLGLILCYKQDICFISNIVISELFHAIERSGFQIFLDKKIITDSGINEEIWNKYTKKERDIKRNEGYNKLGLSIKDIKTWRLPCYEKFYTLYVINEFKNIIQSLPENLNILSGIDIDGNFIKNFLKIKKSYFMMDSNDINHYLIAKNKEINVIITCDNDFKQINDSCINILIIDEKFKF